MTYKATDMLVGNVEEFEQGKKATILGHLQRLYLGDECITNEKIKIYERAKTVLAKQARVKNQLDLIYWETKLTKAKAAAMLNKVIREMKKKQ